MVFTPPQKSRQLWFLRQMEMCTRPVRGCWYFHYSVFITLSEFPVVLLNKGDSFPSHSHEWWVCGTSSVRLGLPWSMEINRFLSDRRVFKRGMIKIME